MCGIETGTAMLISAALMAGGTAASMMMTPTMPQQDLTDYGMLSATQEKANADADAARARQEEARKREELRQNQLAAEGIKTSDTGTTDLKITKQVLGVTTPEDEETA
jgi:hypothetical protein